MPSFTLQSIHGPTEVLFDEKDQSLVDAYSWYRHRGGYISGTLRGKGARMAKTVYMHRLFMQPPEGLTVDHINGIRTDNRRCNLRCVPYSLNNLNQNNRMRKDNTHGVRGASLHRPSGLWQARVTIGGKRHNLGYFSTADAAGEAYQAAVRQWLPAQCLDPRPAAK